jgi:hypothetical protein
MAEDKKQRSTLTDEDMITSPKISRRSLLAGAGVALGGAALAGRKALAADQGEKDNAEADTETDKDDDEDKDKPGADTEADKDDDEDKDKADTGGDESERDAD